jgi:predicted ATPase
MSKPSKKPPESIPELVASLENLKKGSNFKPFIDSLRLYAFKGVKNGSQIDFEFPITALVGPNGSGKSSVLQALYGCPDFSSTGDYWISTALDPISDEEGFRPSIVYTHRGLENEFHEVVKSRIHRKDKPDYWEPSRPIAKLGMQLLAGGKRHPLVKMKVVTIDFRYQLSAFDRFFYLEELKGYEAKQRPQYWIRKRASRILKAMSSLVAKPGKYEAPVQLTQDECIAISRILNKKYQAGKILYHRFHKFWAHTVIFELESTTNALRYTEANAGSGEVAVALLVYKLSRVESGSLILLDEPEYSLHPGAQREVLRYLLEQCYQKQLQVVFTTHASTMIEGLPLGAVKVFGIDPTTERFVVHQDRSSDEAFLSIGQRVNSKFMIRVEDSLAKALISETNSVQFSPEI